LGASVYRGGPGEKTTQELDQKKKKTKKNLAKVQGRSCKRRTTKGEDPDFRRKPGGAARRIKKTNGWVK